MSIESVVAEFPAPMVELRRHIPRTQFHISLIQQHVRTASPLLVDVGGGTSLFPAAAADAGMRVTVIDYFEEVESSPIRALNEEVLNSVFPTLGVRTVTADMSKNLGGALNSLGPVDVFTSFDSIEHWHDSPKPALHEMMEVLKPGGLMVIGVPNAVNVRKRITVPLGRNNWSHMSEWYDKPRFFSHVREPVVADLFYIARDLDLADAEVLGRSWSGYFNPDALVRGLTTMVDHVLRLRPSLCSDLYLVGRKKSR